MTSTTLYWFTHDLRLADNPALVSAARAERLLCVYVLPPQWFRPGRYGTRPMGEQRWRFLHESLLELDRRLRDKGQQLLVLHGQPETLLPQIIDQYRVDWVVGSEQHGFDEVQLWQYLKDRCPQTGFINAATHTLFDRDELPFSFNAFPPSFSQFRKQAETLAVGDPIAEPPSLPPPPTLSGRWPTLPAVKPDPETRFRGGEETARAHLRRYFSGSAPARYKQVRNELDGWQHSTKLSPWLNLGCLSARQVLAELRRYERETERNESTYWIYFELLWREFFQWYALRYGVHLFRFGGIHNKPPLTSFYAERFAKWCHGNTPYPLVNALMHQLNRTGYMSNRGRQIVASCLVNELALDWRFGAAWFEQQLLDYNAGSNWGNWQYIAGVGADPRGGRHFDLAKQQHLYDPEGNFIARWRGDTGSASLDSVDMVDWPQ